MVWLATHEPSLLCPLCHSLLLCCAADVWMLVLAKMHALLELVLPLVLLLGGGVLLQKLILTKMELLLWMLLLLLLLLLLGVLLVMGVLLWLWSWR